jgi:hypothetical protein
VAGARGRAFGPYLGVLASEEEEALSSLEATFASIQPPSEADDEVRQALAPLLSDAVDHAADVRIAQYLGWQWGKYVRPREASRFHVVVLLSVAASVLFAASGVDPVKVTEYSIVLSAAALPLTYFPILVVANDPDYMGDEVNGPVLNAIAFVYLVILVLVAVATIPLMVITKAGA